ncbi:hypothetical protein [Streptomyces sp. NPDC006510]|uniref:hypothetical protein n=1 Tax=Streptomyces sp. NPDC006510 TaxID=3155600 RepID=UPI00339E7C69
MMAAISGGVRDEEVTGIEAALAAMPPDADDLGPRHMRGLVQRHRDWLAANETRAQLRRRWAAFFRDYDALMCPVLSAPAIPHDHRPGGPDVRTIEVNGQTRPAWDLVTGVGIANRPLLGGPHRA